MTASDAQPIQHKTAHKTRIDHKGDKIMAVLHVKENEFQKEVLESEKPVLLDFFATWCGPCKMLGQVLEELDKEQEDFRIVKVDIDENPDLAARWQVSSVPSLFFIKDGEVKDSAVGFFPKPRLLQKMTEAVS